MILRGRVCLSAVQSFVLYLIVRGTVSGVVSDMSMDMLLEWLVSDGRGGGR